MGKLSWLHRNSLHRYLLGKQITVLLHSARGCFFFISPLLGDVSYSKEDKLLDKKECLHRVMIYGGISEKFIPPVIEVS